MRDNSLYMCIVQCVYKVWRTLVRSWSAVFNWRNMISEINICESNKLVLHIADRKELIIFTEFSRKRCRATLAENRACTCLLTIPIHQRNSCRWNIILSLSLLPRRFRENGKLYPLVQYHRVHPRAAEIVHSGINETLHYYTDINFIISVFILYTKRAHSYIPNG